jgi:hypothetical protein
MRKYLFILFTFLVVYCGITAYDQVSRLINRPVVSTEGEIVYLSIN